VRWQVERDGSRWLQVGGEKRVVGDDEAAMRWLIAHWLQTHSGWRISSTLESLLAYEIDKQRHLPPRLSAYFRMTRLLTPAPAPSLRWADSNPILIHR
jgi:hypothetical protein